MSWKPEVTKINKIENHPNADALDIVTLYSDTIVISKKNQFKEGDLVSFLPLDTIPGNNPMFEFLGKDKNKRLKAKRLRGIFSTGLIVPAPEGFNEGDSIIEHFSLTRYFQEFEKSEYKADGLKNISGQGCNDKNPKGFEIPYYDLENARKYSNLFEKGENIILHEKIHGENFSVIMHEDKLYVRSRNFYKREEPDSKWWEVPLRDNFKQKFKAIPDLAVIGELYGNVSGFRYDCQIENSKVYRKFRVFDIYDTKSKKFLPWEKVQEICNQIGLETVPELYRGEWTCLNDIKQYAESWSALNKEHIREGFVIRSLDRNNFMNGDRSILKYVSQQFLESKYA